EPEARAEEEPATGVAYAAARQERQRPLHELADARHDQRDGEHAEQDRSDLDLMLLADSEQPPQPRARQKKGRERRDEPGGDRVRPSIRARPAREHDRQHGEDARRERRDDPRQKRDRDENDQSLLVQATQQAFQPVLAPALPLPPAAATRPAVAAAEPGSACACAASAGVSVRRSALAAGGSRPARPQPPA